MQSEKKERRSFLKHILAGSAVIAGAAVSAKPAKADDAPVKTHGKEILYKESAAFKKYYDSLRS